MGNFDRIANAKPRTATLTFAMNPDDTERLAALRARVDAARSQVALASLAESRSPGEASSSPRVMAEAELAAAEAAEREAGIPFYELHLQQLPVTRIEDLRFSHRPTSKQKERSKVLAGDARAMPGYNEETYPPTLISEACVQVTYSDDPEHPTEALSVEMAAQMIARWSQGNLLHTVAVIEALAQQPTFVGDLGKG